MAKPIKLTFGHIEVTGRTLTEVREKALALLERLSNDLFDSPKLIKSRGHLLLIWRDNYGWGYSLIRPNEPDGVIRVYANTAGGRNTLAENERAGRRHMAQMLMTWDDDAVDVIEHAEDRRDHISWVAWQHRYRAWKEVGRTDDHCHRLASEGLWPQDTVITYEHPSNHAIAEHDRQPRFP